MDVLEETLDLEVLDIEIEEEECDDILFIRQYYINLFFKDKEYYYGGSIPSEILYSSRYLKKIMNIDKINIENAMGCVYKALEDVFEEGQGSIPDDTLYILDLLKMCAKRSISKEYAMGIIIMYLELCEGIEIDI